MNDLLNAEIVTWRAFGLADTFADLPGVWTEEADRGPKLTDVLRVSIGELPADLVQTLTEWRAQANGLLEMQFGNALGTAERMALYERDLPTVELEEFANPYPNWFVLRLSRPIQVRAAHGVVVGWLLDDDGQVANILQSFQQESADYIDGAIAVISYSLGNTNLSHLRFGDNRPFLIAPGRAALAQTRFKISVRDWGVQVGRQPGYADSLFASVSNALRVLPSGRSMERKISGPAGWYVSAKAEETDDLRRFIFAFVGLEMLVTRSERDARAALLERLTNLDSNDIIPAKDLLWPGLNEEFIDRNTVFRFAALASMYTPATAVADVATFRDLAGARNRLFHGAEVGISKTKSVQCLELLGRYLGLVAAKTT